MGLLRQAKSLSIWCLLLLLLLVVVVVVVAVIMVVVEVVVMMIACCRAAVAVLVWGAGCHCCLEVGAVRVLQNCCNLFCVGVCDFLLVLMLLLLLLRGLLLTAKSILACACEI
jgi:hypothetical protein